MTTKSKKIKFTLYMTEQLSEQVEKEASTLGISKNAYITMTLHKALNKDK